MLACRFQRVAVVRGVGGAPEHLAGAVGADGEHDGEAGERNEPLGFSAGQDAE